MELNVAAALKQPGKAFACRMEEALLPQEYAGRTLGFAQPLQLECGYSYDGKAFTLEGRLHFTLTARCARCDEAFIEPLDIPFTERFVKGEDEDSYTFEGDALLLDTMVLDNLYLHLPMKSVCREDCRGLCPVCGCNLNTAQCACTVEEPENPMAKLSALLNEGKEV